MTSITLVSYIEDAGNVAVALTCVHPHVKQSLQGWHSASEFSAYLRAGRRFCLKGLLKPEGLGRNLPPASQHIQHAAPELWLGHAGPSATSCSCAGGCRDTATGTDQVPSAHSENLPHWKNPQQEIIIYFLLVQCMKWCWHRSQIRVEGLPQPMIFKLEDKQLFNMHFIL